MENETFIINFAFISRIEKKLESLRAKSKEIICSLVNMFDKREKKIDNLQDYSFEFIFWGLRFITKSEFSLTNDFLMNPKGEINTYLVKDERYILIKSWTFDELGNINNDYTANDFPDAYLLDFVNNVQKFSIENEVKFLIC